MTKTSAPDDAFWRKVKSLQAEGKAPLHTGTSSSDDVYDYPADIVSITKTGDLEVDILLDRALTQSQEKMSASITKLVGIATANRLQTRPVVEALFRLMPLADPQYIIVLKDGMHRYLPMLQALMWEGRWRQIRLRDTDGLRGYLRRRYLPCCCISSRRERAKVRWFVGWHSR